MCFFFSFFLFVFSFLILIFCFFFGFEKLQHANLLNNNNHHHQTQIATDGKTPSIVLGIGSANFNPSYRGQVSGPTKSLIRHLAQYFPVVLLNEYCTSVCCHSCGERMIHPSSDQAKKYCDLTDRMKQHLTELKTPFEPALTSKARKVAYGIYWCPTKCRKSQNRDRNASINMFSLLTSWINGTNRPPFLMRQVNDCGSTAQRDRL